MLDADDPPMHFENDQNPPENMLAHHPGHAVELVFRQPLAGYVEQGRDGKIDAASVALAIRKFGIDPAKPDPLVS